MPQLSTAAGRLRYTAGPDGEPPMRATALAFALLAAAPAAFGGKIEADPAKDYRLSPQNGPWLITVATLHKPGVDRPDELEAGKEDESVARKAARELVLDLRKRGIPAYVFELRKSRESVRTVDRLGRQHERKTLSDDAQISVLAGNYTSVNDPTAVKTLDWVKRFRPPSFGDKAIYRKDGGKGPLAGAFLTINPLMNPDEVRRRTVDPDEVKLLRHLNAGNPYATTKCGGDYTLRIKTFKGRYSMKKLNGVTDRLNEAGQQAFNLCASLRDRGVDAYVWHDRYESVVSVGGFTGKDDPGITSYRKRFTAQKSYNPQTGVTQVVYKTEPPGRGNGVVQSAAEALNTWYFDAEPKLIPVPRMPGKRR